MSPHAPREDRRHADVESERERSDAIKEPPCKLFWLVLLTLLAGGPLAAGDHTRTLDFGGRSRSYIVHVPPKYDAKQPTPVVLAFHGAGSNAEQMVHFCGLNEKADQGRLHRRLSQRHRPAGAEC